MKKRDTTPKAKPGPCRVAFRLKEVSAMTGIPASTLRARVHDGTLSVITAFGPWLISKKELDRLLGVSDKNI